MVHWLPDRILDLIGWPAGWSRAWPAGILVALTFLVAAWLASTILLQVVGRYLRGLASRTTSDLDDRLLELMDRPIRRIILLGGIYWALQFLPLGPALRAITTGIAYVLSIWLAVKMLAAIALVLLQAFGKRFHDPRDRVAFERDYLPLVSKLLRTVLAVLGLISVLHHFG